MLFKLAMFFYNIQKKCAGTSVLVEFSTEKFVLLLLLLLLLPQSVLFVIVRK